MEQKHHHFDRAMIFYILPICCVFLSCGIWIYLVCTIEDHLNMCLTALFPIIFALSQVYRDKANKEIEEADKIDNYGKL